jgi:hypothetical protein
LAQKPPLAVPRRVFTPHRGDENQYSPKGSSMKTLKWFTPRTLLATMMLPLLASCADKASDVASPDLRVQMTGEEAPANWQIHVCKIGPEGTVANFEAAATSGTLKVSNPFHIASGLLGSPPSCTLAWEGAAGTPVTFNVTELASAGLVLDTIRFNRNVPGASYTGTTATITEEYLGHADVKGFAVITYKNDAAPTPLTAVKTAVGTYDIPVTWRLTKTVTPTSHTGTAGTNAGSSTWTVTATRIEGAPTNHKVEGTITVSNPGAIAQTFTVTDDMNGTAVPVVCPTNTVAGGGSVTCTYSAAIAGATLNTATVKAEGYPDVVATAAVNYTSSFTGDQTTTLADPRFSFSQVISTSTTKTFPETFPCPSDASQYTNGVHTRTEKNTATLKGDNTDLSADATVNITCTMPEPEGETATGAGFPWAATQGAPSNWFMYTPWVTTGAYRGISAAATSTQAAGTNLIAGQHYVAGRITGVRGTTTTITITLNSAWGFVNDGANVKINPMSCTTAQPYKSPGAFTYHRSASGNVITVTGLPNTACYGIHADVFEK